MSDFTNEIDPRKRRRQYSDQLVSCDAGGSPISGGGTLSGDVTGATSSNTVEKIRNRTVASTAPSNNQGLLWNNGASEWQPTTITSSMVTNSSGVTGSTVTDALNTVNTALASCLTTSTVLAGDVTGVYYATVVERIRGVSVQNEAQVSAGTGQLLYEQGTTSYRARRCASHRLLANYRGEGSSMGTYLTGAGTADWTYFGNATGWTNTPAASFVANTDHVGGNVIRIAGRTNGTSTVGAASVYYLNLDSGTFTDFVVDVWVVAITASVNWGIAFCGGTASGENFWAILGSTLTYEVSSGGVTRNTAGIGGSWGTNVPVRVRFEVQWDKRSATAPRFNVAVDSRYGSTSNFRAYTKASFPSGASSGNTSNPGNKVGIISEHNSTANSGIDVAAFRFLDLS